MSRHFWKLLLLLIVLFGGSVFLAVRHWRPLISSREWSASYAHQTGQPRRAEVYSMLFRSSRLFVHLPEGRSQGYEWFAVDLHRKNVAVPNGPGTMPYLHFNHDMELGVTLDDPKIQDDWKISWRDGDIRFANASFSIHLVTR